MSLNNILKTIPVSVELKLTPTKLNLNELAAGQLMEGHRGEKFKKFHKASHVFQIRYVNTRYVLHLEP